MNTAFAAHRFRSLDALRGLAAMLVVVHHLVVSIPETLPENLFLHSVDTALFIGGRFAVLLFFVLSGFVLALPYFDGTNQTYGPYLVRRACRLYPPYAFTVLVAAILSGLLGGEPLAIVSDIFNRAWASSVTGTVVASHLFMTGLHNDATRLDGPLWSLIIEMRISLIFPLLVLYVRRFGWSGIAASLIVAFTCNNARVSLGDTSAHTAESITGLVLLTMRYVPFFLVGVMAAWRLERLKRLFAHVSLKVHATLFIGAASVMVLMAYVHLPAPGYGDLFYGLVALYLIISCAAFPKLAKKLSGPLCLWFGDISYSLYLIHVPVLLTLGYLLHGRLPLAVILAVALPAMLVAAHLMHYSVERPSMKLGRRLAQRFESAAQRKAAGLGRN
jgi:peptidoglycan/LPS O-acetylase OafA/YrhL